MRSTPFFCRPGRIRERSGTRQARSSRQLAEEEGVGDFQHGDGDIPGDGREVVQRFIQSLSALTNGPHSRLSGRWLALVVSSRGANASAVVFSTLSGNPAG